MADSADDYVKMDISEDARNRLRRLRVVGPVQTFVGRLEEMFFSEPSVNTGKKTKGKGRGC